MFSRSAIFSNINTKRRLSGTFSIIFSMPSVTSTSLQSLSLKSIFYSLHVSLILFLFSCLISIRNSIFLDHSIPPPLCHLLLISVFVLYSPVLSCFSCIFPSLLLLFIRSHQPQHSLLSASSFSSFPHPLSFSLFCVCITIPSFLTLSLLERCDTVVMVTPIIFWHEWRIPY